MIFEYVCICNNPRKAMKNSWHRVYFENPIILKKKTKNKFIVFIKISGYNVVYGKGTE